MSIDLIKYVDRKFFENIVSVFKAILRSFQVGSVIIKAIVLPVMYFGDKIHEI